MSARLVALILVASLTPGLAAAKKPESKLHSEDRYVYAQPDAAPTPARPWLSQPSSAPTSRPAEPDSNNANGS